MPQEAASPSADHALRAFAAVFAEDGPPLQGILLGCVLGSVLWLMAGCAVCYVYGYLRDVLPYLWCLVGGLLLFAVVQIVRAYQLGSADPPLSRPRTSGVPLVAGDALK